MWKACLDGIDTFGIVKALESFERASVTLATVGAHETFSTNPVDLKTAATDFTGTFGAHRDTAAIHFPTIFAILFVNVFVGISNSAVDAPRIGLALNDKSNEDGHDEETLGADGSLGDCRSHHLLEDWNALRIGKGIGKGRCYL